MTVPVLGEASVLGVGDPRVARAQAGGDPPQLFCSPWSRLLGDWHVGTTAFQAGPRWAGRLQDVPGE